jgi:ribosomal protein S18 acetylase RimI-like enzyme
MTTDGRRTLLQVKLEVHSTNYKAINLYKKFGFTHLGEYKVFITRDISKF